MNAGRTVKWERLELKAALSASGAADGSASGSCKTAWAPADYYTVPGIEIVITTGEFSTDVLFTAPDILPYPGYINHNVSGGFAGSTSAEAVLDNVRLYAYPAGSWELRFDECRLVVNGSTVQTIGPKVLTSDYFAPAGVPLFGIPARVDCGAAPGNLDILEDQCTENALEESAMTATCVGGWRFKLNGTYYTPSVNVSLPATPGISCTPDAPPFDFPSGSTTYNLTAHAYAVQSQETVFLGNFTCQCDDDYAIRIPSVQDVYQTTWKNKSTSGSVMGLPNLPRSVKRMNTDYAALILRGGTPQTKKASFSACGVDCVRPPDDRTDAITEVHPRMTSMLSTVLNAAHEIEDPLGFTCYAPAAWAGQSYQTQSDCTITSDAGCCRNTIHEPCDLPLPCWDVADLPRCETHGSSFPSFVEADIDNEYLLPYLYHTDDVARYINYIGCPHWSYFYWFPPNTYDSDDDGIPDEQDQWEVLGDRIAQEYWAKIRHQWLMQADLPVGEQKKTRSHLLSCTGYEGGFAGFIHGITPGGIWTGWWGISNFDAEKFSPPSTKAFDSNSELSWTLENCTGAFGASEITLTPTGGHTDLIASLDLGDFVRALRMYAHLCKQIEVDWTATNISAVNVYLVSITGAKALLATAPGTYNRPTAASETKYAGSHRHEFGTGYIDDQGVNVASGGLDLLGDPESVFAFQLLSGQGAKYLRFEITVVDSGTTCKIDYPVMHIPPTDAVIYNESAHHQCLIWASGPGVRFGCWRWYQSGGVLTEPAATNPGFPPIGYKSTILEYMCWRRVALEGKDRLDGVAAQIAATYDEIEGQEYVDAVDLTIAFLLEGGKAGIGIMVSTLRETPPMAHFPGLARNADYVANGSPAQESWSHACDKRFYVSESAVHLWEPPASVWTSVLAGTPAEWVVTKHQHVVDNNEDILELRRGTALLAKIRPWHGCLLLGEASEASDGVPFYDVGPAMTHWRGYVDSDGKLNLGRSSNAPVSWTDFLIGDEVDWVRGVQARTRKQAELYVLYRETSTGDVKLAKSETAGESITAVLTLGNYTQADICWTCDGRLLIYYLDGTTIKGKIYDSQLSLVRSFSTDLTGIDDASIRAQEVVTGQGVWHVAIQHTIGGVIKIAHSVDGETFTGVFGVATSSQGDICWTRDRRLYAAYYDAGTLKIKVYDLQMNQVRTITTNLTGMDDAGFDIMESVKRQGQHRMGILYLASGVLLFKESADGQNWI